MKLKYTTEKNVLILISMLKRYGIRRVVVSPGTANYTFVGSLQNDSFFELLSVADERSAAYMACGIAAESNEPVVITCTGATASRNYLPALTEAYYRKLPIVAIMSHEGEDLIRTLRPQQIDRRVDPSDTYIEKITLRSVSSYREEQYAVLQLNRAFLALQKNGGGPIQIEMITGCSKNFNIQTLPEIRKITRFTLKDNLPDLPKGSIYIVVGSHKKFSTSEINNIDLFCKRHEAIVLCDHTSNYKGKYGLNLGLILSQKRKNFDCKYCDLVIHIGEISGDYYGTEICPNEVWRVNEDGEIKDLYWKLSSIFVMSEDDFFNAYSSKDVQENSLKDELTNIVKKVYSYIPELPFSNIWIAKNTIEYLPDNSVLHLGILNSLRAWNYFPLKGSVYAYSNVGGFGIDGILSTCIGASLVHSNQLYYCVLGDLAFFYDMNSIGNRHLPCNIRIMVINNGGGTEFLNYNHPAHDILGAAAIPNIAAVGHYGNKSKCLLKHYAEDIGFKYLMADSKETYKSILQDFLDPHISDRPILLEVFTNPKDESNALEIMMNLVDNVDDITTFDKIRNLKSKTKQFLKRNYNKTIDKLKLQ